MALEPAFNVDSARIVLERDGRAHIQHALAETDARTLHSEMQNAPWRTTFNNDKGVFILARDVTSEADAAQYARIVKESQDQIGQRFQFLYDSFPIWEVSEAGQAGPPSLMLMYDAFNSEAWLQALRALTGDDSIAYVDAQATRYRTGHFLTTHSDRDADQDRLYAYVLNLTPSWQLDWGGLLLFHDADGHVERAYAPRWNALNIFKVPQPHSVSLVTPGAQADRFSITGWLWRKKPKRA